MTRTVHRGPAALAALTTRGRWLLALAPPLIGSAFAFGQPDLLRVGLLLLLLPLVAVLVVARTRYRLTCVRVLDPASVEVGRPAGVHLRLHNVSRLPSGVLLMEDTLPFTLGGRPRFVLDRIEPAGERDVTYTLQPGARGRYRLGPLGVRLTDPFGLCELHRSFTAIDHLLVTPVVVPLPAVRLGGDRSSTGDTPSAALASGTDDATTREYRRGDDLRKVHWRSTARVGELMVRQEEQPRQQRATVVLDSRRSAHRGEGPTCSYEVAVSVAASIGVNLLRAGYAVGLDGDGIPPVPEGGQATAATILSVLAEVQPTDRRDGLASTIERLSQAPGGSAHIAVLGALGNEDAERLARVSVPGRVAVLLDTDTWSGAPAGGTARSAAVLSRTGWRVVELPFGTDLAAAWGSLGAGSTSGVRVRT